FSRSANCEEGKVVHMYGDSTIRQWFEYLNTTLPGSRLFGCWKKIGPNMALDHENNILVTYRCHGPPIRFGNVKVNELYYIANEVDRIAGGANIVVVVGIWSHFSTFPMEIYIRRLMTIRSAVSRLLARAPDTMVVIRTANLKALKSLYETLTNSMNVHLVDAWEMVLAHHFPHNLHPEPPIIKNMINVLLSYICPSKGSLIVDEDGNLK
uniref:NXPE C-terminal domain-containing protein n=1 Tax=Gouania willdenowi TaxID=441366 RepID=A0A8C5DJR2_GOUWI